MGYNKDMNDEAKNKLNEYSSGDLGSFMDNYRRALEAQKTADTNTLNNQRNLDYTGIMVGANRRGLLHSNFPARDKLKYDTMSYEPALTKIQTSYQTGLDTLYNNAAKYLNQIKSYREKTADTNALYQNNNNTPSTGANVAYTKEAGYQFTDDQGSPISYYEWASRQGDQTAATNYLKEMADKGDANARHAVAGLSNTDRGAGQLGNLTAEEISALKTLGFPNEVIAKFGTRQ